MATTEITLKCPVCVEVYKEPRKLPGCSHSFCEDCLLIYIHNLKTEGKLGLEFPCPVCRLLTKSPEDNQSDIDWVQTMEKDASLAASAAETDDNLCSPCKYLDKTTVARFYCWDCQENLCSSCSETLHASKLNRDHSVMETESKTTDKSEKLHAPAMNLMSQLLMCSEHSENPVKYYCELHDNLSCSKCAVVKHANCKKLTDIKEIPKPALQAETNTLINDSEKLTEHLNQCIGIYKENEADTKQDIEKIRTQFQEMKQKVIQLLDILEDNINQESGAMAKSLNIEGLDEISNIKELIQKLNGYSYILQTCLTRTSEHHAFIIVKKVKRIFSDIERIVVQRGSDITKKGVELKTGELLDKLLDLGPNDANLLADIQETHTTVDGPCYRDVGSQINFKVEDQDSVTIVAEENSAPTYNSILYLPNNHTLLLDSFRGYSIVIDELCKIVLFRKFGSKTGEKRINFDMHQCGSYMQNELIAINLAVEKKICFVSPEELILKGEIVCKHTPLALCALTNNELAVSWEDPVAFSIIVLQGGAYSEIEYFTKDKSGRQLKSFDHMAVDKNLHHIIQPCHVDKAVYCFSYNGEPIFKYKKENLVGPLGVAVHPNHRIILVCDMSSRIHILSQYGVPMKIVEEQCPREPLAIAFNKAGTQFIVTDSDSWNKLHLFTIQVENQEKNASEDEQDNLYIHALFEQ